MRYNHGYISGMKPAISIPDQIFTAAEKTAKRLGISRSELYATTVRDYVQSHVSEEITEKLNQVYSAEESSLDSSLQSMRSISLEPVSVRVSTFSSLRPQATSIAAAGLSGKRVNNTAKRSNSFEYLLDSFDLVLGI
jgi:hypothetical protein